jgi:hypothetical protein
MRATCTQDQIPTQMPAAPISGLPALTYRKPGLHRVLHFPLQRSQFANLSFLSRGVKTWFGGVPLQHRDQEQITMSPFLFRRHHLSSARRTPPAPPTGTVAATAAAVAGVASATTLSLCRAIPPAGGNATFIADNPAERRRNTSQVAASNLKTRSTLKPPTTAPKQGLADQSEWHMRKIVDAILALATENGKYGLPRQDPRPSQREGGVSGD